jgi:predicted ATPase/DNA-binding CsgD family transcriptional regulator
MLVGRARELNVLEQLLVGDSARLVTLTGPGGIGKTRLALAAAERLRGAYPDGVACVDLAPVVDATLVLTAIANTLGVAEPGDRPIVKALVAAIGDRRLLLILDNLEHVLDATADVSGLIQACPALRVLVTSRAALHVDGEREVAVPPLQLPAAGFAPDLEAFAAVESVRLFLQRAQAARADFQLTGANAGAVAGICVRLDGIPLAIELAAARMKVLSAQQIAERLADCFRLLTSEDSVGPARHRTLRTALDWSFLMLGQPERALLRRMAVFLGGASIEAVERLCGTDPLDGVDALHCLARLVDQSLVTVAEHAGVARYRLLEPVRQYALEHLRAAGEESAVRDRHAAWFLELAEQTEPELAGTGQMAVLELLASEYANLRQAVGWYLERRLAESAQRMAWALWKFCEMRGHADEGERWLNAALDLGGGSSTARSKALHGAANLAFVRGDYERTARLHEQNVALRRQLGDRQGVGITLFHLVSVRRSRGDSASAIELCRESLALFREQDDALWCARALNSLGLLLTDTRAFGAARDALEEGLALFRRLGGTRGVAIALENLADLDRFAGDYARADARLQHSLDFFNQLEDAWGSSGALESLALVACARGLAQRSAVLFGAAEAQREEAGAALAPVDVPVRESAMDTLRLQLGAQAVESAVARGRALSRSEALAFAQCPAGAPAHSAPRVTARVLRLTEREREVAALVARGLSNRQIADELVFTKHTADKHVGNILGKLELASRAQLAVWWIIEAGHPVPSSYF